MEFLTEYTFYSNILHSNYFAQQTAARTFLPQNIPHVILLADI